MNTSDENQTIDLDSFAELAGFPVELIKKELFNGVDADGEVSLAKLREVMVSYLNSTMMEE